MSGHSEFLAASIEAVRRSGDDGLAALGWWEMLGDLDDPEVRTALFTVFRAQGRELASTGALGALMALPFLGDPAAAADTSVALRRRNDRWTVVGPLRSQVLIDVPGSGAAVVAAGVLDLVPIDVPGRQVLHEFGVDGVVPAPSIDEPRAAVARTRSDALGRMALAQEMVGATEAALALAVDYAQVRQQFGRPIGSFQALRHLLAWAQAECAVMQQAADLAVRLDGSAPEHFDLMVKALVGRNARRVCERTLQSFGGIGFTREHDHHHFHSRVLALDALIGSSNELTRRLGAQWRRHGGDLAIPRALLTATNP